MSTLFNVSPRPEYFSPEHEEFRRTVRAFVEREIAPHVNAWDEAGTFPRELYRKAAAVGIIGLGYPEEYGGTPADQFFSIVSAEEIARAGCGGLQASLGSHGIGMPPVVAHGSEALKRRVLPPVIRGEKIAALAITEPGGGSDVAALKTTAVRDGDHYVVNGEKTFITSGMRADFLSVAVRTDPANRGPGGVSLLLIDGDTPGLSRTELKKMGWWSSDTAHLHFDNCRVPVANLIGEEGRGFKAIMHNFNSERLMMAALKTTAVRDGDHYVVNGEKTFITSGMRADFLSVAVRTDPANRGPGGVSLLLIDGDTPGLSRTELKKMGWWSSDTAHLHFDNCRVPVANLIGEEGKGFKAIMHNFNSERLMMAALACAYAEACTTEALDWARERKTFGAALSERQVIRHKLVDMATKVETARTLVYDLAWRLQQGLGPAEAMVARTCMAKVVATQAMQFCADQAVQILGGMGFMRGTKSERIYREVKVMIIGGGSEEIMKDLAARQLGI